MSFLKKLLVTTAGAGLTGTVFAVGLVISTTSSARAVIINGSFETGYTPGWTTSGNTSIQTASFGSGPTNGIQQALLTNASGSVGASSLETFLAVATGSLNSFGNGTATSGSAIKQTFEANAGDVLTFDWNFLTNEDTPSATGSNDFAFYRLFNSPTELADTGFSNGTGSGFVTSGTLDFREETGFQTPSITIATTGNYILGFGVVDVKDNFNDSGLLVDNVQL